MLFRSGGPFKAQLLLRSGDRVWSELGELRGRVGFDADTEKRGPYDVGFALTRTLEDRPGEQRIVIIADGDFLSNSALGNSGNLDLGMRIFNWLSTDDSLLGIPVRTDPDSTLRLSRAQTAVIGFGWLLGAPLAFAVMGLTIWLRRRHR